MTRRNKNKKQLVEMENSEESDDDIYDVAMRRLRKKQSGLPGYAVDGVTVTERGLTVKVRPLNVDSLSYSQTDIQQLSKELNLQENQLQIQVASEQATGVHQDEPPHPQSKRHGGRPPRTRNPKQRRPNIKTIN